MPISDWFSAAEGTDTRDPTRDWEGEMTRAGAEAETLFARATAEVIADQVEAGIDIPTDGEVWRENYIHYHCRRIQGIDFEATTEKQLRGHYKARLPTITGPVRAGAPFLAAEWRAAQANTTRPLKMTLPGPITIADTVADAHYGSAEARGRDLAAALNAEVRALDEAGCRHIQVDEPLFARQPEAALRFGLDHLARCFEGVGDEATRLRVAPDRGLGFLGRELALTKLRNMTAAARAVG